LSLALAVTLSVPDTARPRRRSRDGDRRRCRVVKDGDGDAAEVVRLAGGIAGHAVRVWLALVVARVFHEPSRARS